MGGSGTNQFYIYNIGNNEWLAGTPLPRNVWGAAAASWNGKVYLIGGDNDFNPGSTSAEVNVYDIATNTWEANGVDMPVSTSAMGFVQLANHVYVVGGWGDIAPTGNVTATQRYDMAQNNWQTGATFTSARADLALTATSENLYALGGDNDSGSFFDPTTTVQQLSLASWENGTWADTGDPLPVATTSNSGGFCSAGNFFSAQVHTVGGLGIGTGINGLNRFLGRPNENCFSIYTDIPWLVLATPTGTVSPDGELEVAIQIDARQLLFRDVVQATLVVVTNDADNPITQIPIQVTVDYAKIYLPIIRK
jgi:hypothetical protein